MRAVRFDVQADSRLDGQRRPALSEEKPIKKTTALTVFAEALGWQTFALTDDYAGHANLAQQLSNQLPLLQAGFLPVPVSGLGRLESAQEVSEHCNWLRVDEALR